METFNTDPEIKTELQDVMPATILTLTHTSSQQLLDYFTDNGYGSDNMEYHDSPEQCLDEIDGEFKSCIDLTSNVPVPDLDGDFKNFCHKCNLQFHNVFAIQNHQIFNHPCASMLTRSAPSASINTFKRRKYNWLNEPMQLKIPKNAYEPSHIIQLRDKKQFLKKYRTTHQLVQVTDIPNIRQSFTLASIKTHPQDGIRVVKKSDINFHQLKLEAAQKILYSNKKQLESRNTSHLSEACKTNPVSNKNSTFLKTKAFLSLLDNPSKRTVTYLCKRCNLEMDNLFVFDHHMKQHIISNFACPICGRTFATKIGFAKHVESCVQTEVVKVVHLKKNQ